MFITSIPILVWFTWCVTLDLTFPLCCQTSYFQETVSGIRSEENNENSKGELMSADFHLADSTSSVYLFFQTFIKRQLISKARESMYLS